MKNQFNTPEWQRRFRNLTTDIKQQKTVLLLGTEIVKWGVHYYNRDSFYDSDYIFLSTTNNQNK